MLTTAGERKIGASGGPNCNSIARVSRKFLGQRDFVPAQVRRAHVDGEHAGRTPQQATTPAAVSKFSLALAGLVADQRSHTTHAVAAGAGFRAVIVVDADERIGAGRAGG